MGRLRGAIETELPSDTEIRHDLHRHPELGYNEHRTSGVVKNHLAKLPIQVKENLAGGTGVLAYLPATTNPDSARTVALRADMDALPIVELTGLSYESSTPGVMHACGHDGHTTILLATARTLSQLPERPNNVLFLFQPAEEGGAGGQRMCQDGALNGSLLGKGADVIYGLHGNPWQPLGRVSTRVGPIMASATELVIEITGKGSHAAYPHFGIDPVVIASHIVTALQTVASRSVNPLESVVVTIGKVEAGVAHNVIPDTATLLGTLRTLSDEVYELAVRRIEEIVKNVAAAFGATATVDLPVSYPVTFNHAEPTERFRKIARQIVGEEALVEEAYPSMGAEDFSFYGRQVPACFYFLGLRGADQASYPNLHAPQFDFNDAAIPTGVEMMCELALNG